jgi:hypothetical protein
MICDVVYFAIATQNNTSVQRFVGKKRGSSNKDLLKWILLKHNIFVFVSLETKEATVIAFFDIVYCENWFLEWIWHVKFKVENHYIV